MRRNRVLNGKGVISGYQKINNKVYFKPGEWYKNQSGENGGEGHWTIRAESHETHIY